ncbi:MAG: hypothetical protein A3A51_02970 [Candidatus Levybacteria bacterium RIFCSPLOWO2_01_FULL_39_10]|nr:MAG: hypothetical protein A3A51_02970 [Candidatus Levybacteria bacterium RIFCSPLOWO2_01_FULL_39_10]
MSGHSKWSTIKRQKGFQDLWRGKTFTKISNAITIAVKSSGGIGDPRENPKLRLAVEAAKEANMPKANIERAIERAKTKGAGEFQEVIYEGFGPGGVSIIVEAATDNTNRTTSEVKSLFNKYNARLGQMGSTTHLFKQTGKIEVDLMGKSIDILFMLVADAGADDVLDEKDQAVIYTDMSRFDGIKNQLSETGYEVLSSSIVRKPISKIEVDGQTREKIENFVNDLEEIDDVQKVFTNAKI